MLKRFIRDHTLRLMSEEIIDRKAATHFSEDSINPYFHTQDTAAYPARHPMNTFLERSSGFIPGDACESGTINHTLFEHPAVGRFLADCLGLCDLYPYSDPLAGLTSNIQEPGQQFT